MFGEAFWKRGASAKRRPTMAEQLADRMDDFYDECEIAATSPDGKLIPPHASRRAFAWLSAADWIRHARFHEMQALLAQGGVFTPSALSGDVQVRMAILTSPYIMTDGEFRDLLTAVPVRAAQYRAQREAWQRALAAPAPPVHRGESVSDAVARVQGGVTVRASYDLGRCCLRQNMAHATSDFHFLAPYAIARVRRLGRIGPPDPAAAPDFEKLSDAEAFAANLLHQTLSAGVRICDLMAEFLTEDETDTGPFAEIIYAVQQQACDRLVGASLPDPLPMETPRRLADPNHDLCDLATLLVQKCILQDAGSRRER